jgi:hypothetical protein
MWFATRERMKTSRLVAIVFTALASVHCGTSDTGSDDGDSAGDQAFTAAATPDAHIVGTWELVQKDSNGKAIPLSDQQKEVGGVTEWKPEFNVLRYTFTTDEGSPDTHGNKRFTGSYLLRKDGSDTATETVSIVYSTDSAAGQVRLKETTSANASTDSYEVDKDTLTLKSSGHTSKFVKSK